MFSPAESVIMPLHTRHVFQATVYENCNIGEHKVRMSVLETLHPSVSMHRCWREFIWRRLALTPLHPLRSLQYPLGLVFLPLIFAY